MPAQPQPSQSQSTATGSVAQNRVHTFASRHYRPERQARHATLPCTRRHPQEEDPIPSLLPPARKITRLPSHAAVRAVGSIDPNHKACSRLQVHAPCDQCLEPKSVPHWTHSTAHTTAPRCTLHTSRVTIPGSRSADPTPHSQLRLPGVTHPHAAPQACVLGSWPATSHTGPLLGPQPRSTIHNPTILKDNATPQITFHTPQDVPVSPQTTKPKPGARDVAPCAARRDLDPRTQGLAPRTRPPSIQTRPTSHIPHTQESGA